MSDSPDISANIKLELDDYQRSIQRAIRSADEFDTSLDDLLKQANQTEKALNDLNTSIDVEIDTNLASLLDADRLIQGLDTTIQPLVDINVVNEAAAKSLLDDFNTTLTPKLDIETSELDQAQTLLNRLDSEVVNVKIDADDSELTTAKRKVEDIDGESANVKVDADTSDADRDIATIQSSLEALQKLAIIDIVMNLPASMPSAEDFPLLGSIMAASDAANNIEAKLGKAAVGNAPQYQAQAQDLYTGGIGETQSEASDALLKTIQATKDETGKLARTGEDFFNITERGWHVSVMSGEDYNTLIDTANTMVSTGLVPTYEKAFDVLATGYQNNLNYQGDLNDSVKEYGGNFAELGLGADEVFSIFERGQKAGIFNTDYLSDTLKEVNTRAKNAVSGPGPERDALKKLGVLDEAKAYQAGEIAGTEYIDALFTSIETGLASGRIKPADVVAAVGVKAEDIPIGTLSDVVLGGTSETFTDTEGAASDVQDAMTRGLESSITEAQRLIETELAQSLNDAFDIDGKIQQFNDGVKVFADELRNGATIPQAIEVAFQIPGFAETADRLASAMGNLGISFMELVANILDAMGRGDAASTVRGTIAQAAEAQLTFDLKLADDGAGVSAAVKTAIDRGVSEADVVSSLQTAGSELIADGDLTKAEEFRAALSDLSTIELSPQLAGYLSGKGIDTKNLEAVKEALTGFTARPGQDVGAFGTFADYESAFEEAKTTIGEIDFATTAKDALLPFSQELTQAKITAQESMQGIVDGANEKMPQFTDSIMSGTLDTETQLLGVKTGFTDVQTALTTMTTAAGDDMATYGTTLSTATNDVNTFASNTDVQFNETVTTAVNNAGNTMLTFGETILNTMLGASEDVQGLIDKLLSIGSLDLTVPAVNVGGFTAAPDAKGGIPGKAVGGTIEAGTVSDVHAGERLMAGGADISVLNRQTTSAIDAAIAQYAASAGLGGSGGGNVTNNYINVTFNTSGAAATAAAMDNTRGIRGF